MEASKVLLAACCLVSVYWIPKVEAGTYTEANTLLTSLLSGYDTSLKPTTDQSSTLQINIQLFLLAVTNMDTVEGTLSTAVGIKLVWTDQNLVWNPASHGNIGALSIKQDKVWLPPITVSNNRDLKNFGGSWMFVKTFFNGLTIWAPPAKLDTLCDFNMKYWPFDKQICEIKFVTLAHEENEVVFTIEGLDKSAYSDNGEWVLEDSHFYRTTLYDQSQAVFVLKFRRLALFYILTIILPILGVASMNALVFMLPSDSGERVGFSITIMLSVTVFLTIISTELPRTANPVSLMAIYIMITMAICSFSTVCVIYNLNLHYRSDKVPITRRFRIIYNVTKYFSGISLCRKKINPEQRECVSACTSIAEVETLDNPGKEKTVFMKNCNDKDDRESMSTKNEEEITWQDVSAAVDKMLFVLINILTLIPSIIFLFYLALASDYPSS